MDQLLAYANYRRRRPPCQAADRRAVLFHFLGDIFDLPHRTAAAAGKSDHLKELILWIPGEGPALSRPERKHFPPPQVLYLPQMMIPIFVVGLLRFNDHKRYRRTEAFQ
jgi:hypothetical protein